jgi:uncharacterized protein YdaU (DUF1376 family)
MDLTLEERGAYATILDLLYQEGRPIAYEGQERLLAGRCQCSTRKVQAVVRALIAKGKLALREDGSLTNRRFELEMEKDRAARENAVQTGRVGGVKRAENALKIARKSSENFWNGAENVIDLNEIKEMGQGCLKGASTSRARISDAQSYKGSNEPFVEDPEKQKPEAQTVPGGADDEAFGAFWSASSPDMRRRSVSRAKLRPVWQRACRAAGGADVLRRALVRYLAEDADARAGRGHPALERWLANGRWEAWISGGQDGAGGSVVIVQTVSDAAWAAALRQHDTDGRWPAYLGPAPGEIGHARPGGVRQAGAGQ